MYESYYHFQAKPFQLSPDPRFFFASRGHRRAMAYLVYGAQQGEGFIVITGEIGAGKTLLGNALAGKLASQNVVLAHVVSTHLKADDVVRMVAAAFGLPQQRNKAALLNSVEQFLVACHGQGKRALLIVDEAQNLPANSVEELRMLSNYLCAAQPVLQIFLLGQPEFRKMLRRPGMEQLRQRVIASCHLGPMGSAETEAYIIHRLQTVGWRDDPSFSPDAFTAIFQHSGGIPRKINVLCDRLLLFGRLEEKHEFNAEDVVEVIDDFQQDEFAPAEWRSDREVGT
ncbi:MAG: XrtA-associated ATPase [Gammaproteobacteria bacterium]|nr:XrtA-associated ATPase [Gammaproteobacteria bacterium]MDH3412157.1 XrtA-associated ATPase [Gammaproteobacteria bacterium]